ncbi:uncharacterized protein METZ01_LOCUS344424, partial [marine metagenome]
RAGRRVLPLPHRPLPGGRCHTGRGVAGATRRRRGGTAGLQLPPHADHGGPVAGPCLRQDKHPQLGAGGPRGPDPRGVGHGQGAASRYHLHPRCQRGAGAGGDEEPDGQTGREPGEL